jgi:hypothetical protein
MHCKPLPPQQSAVVVHRSSVGAQPVLAPHVPDTHEPAQQSMPLVHPCPFCLHGERVANARMLPLASSCPGR